MCNTWIVMMLMEVRQEAFSYGEEESKNSVTGGEWMNWRRDARKSEQWGEQEAVNQNWDWEGERWGQSDGDGEGAKLASSTGGGRDKNVWWGNSGDE